MAKKTPARRAAAASAAPFDSREALVRAWEINGRINAYLLEAIDERAWRADPPGGKGRTIAAIAAHMHNVRVMWLKMTKAGGPPAQLDRTSVTPGQAIAALAESTEAIARLLSAAAAGNGRVPAFKPDVVSFFGYLVAHDAHHRGQISAQARQVGFPLDKKVTFGMWEWGRR